MKLTIPKSFPQRRHFRALAKIFLFANQPQVSRAVASAPDVGNKVIDVIVFSAIRLASRFGVCFPVKRMFRLGYALIVRRDVPRSAMPPLPENDQQQNNEKNPGSGVLIHGKASHARGLMLVNSTAEGVCLAT